MIVLGYNIGVFADYGYYKWFQIVALIYQTVQYPTKKQKPVNPKKPIVHYPL